MVKPKAYKTNGRMAQFQNIRLNSSFQEKLDKIFDIDKFISENDEIYNLEIALLKNKILIQSNNSISP
jgi:hypothetical protein